MKIEEFIEPSGLVCGFYYHDQILEAFMADGKSLSMRIRTSEGTEIHLEFSGVHFCTIRNYFPGTIILSIFVWSTKEIPQWMANNDLYNECLQEGPVTSKLILFMDSSFGASVLVSFDSLRISKVENAADGMLSIFEFE